MEIVFKTKRESMLFLYMLREYLRVFGVLPITYVFDIIDDLSVIMRYNILYQILEDECGDDLCLTRHFDYKIICHSTNLGIKLVLYGLRPIMESNECKKPEKECETEYINNTLFPMSTDEVHNGLSEAIIYACEKNDNKEKSVFKINETKNTKSNDRKSIENLKSLAYLYADFGNIKGRVEPNDSPQRFNENDICINNWNGSKPLSVTMSDSFFVPDWKLHRHLTPLGKSEQQGYTATVCTIDAFHPEYTGVPEIERVIYSGPATIVWWKDNTKTVVKCQDGDVYDPEKGLAMAIAKKALGNNNKWFNVFKKHKPRAYEIYYDELTKTHNEDTEAQL